MLLKPENYPLSIPAPAATSTANGIKVPTDARGIGTGHAAGEESKHETNGGPTGLRYYGTKR